MLQGLSALPFPWSRASFGGSWRALCSLLLLRWNKGAGRSSDLSVTPELLLCRSPESPSRQPGPSSPAELQGWEMHREPAGLLLHAAPHPAERCCGYPWEEHLPGGAFPGRALPMPEQRWKAFSSSWDTPRAQPGFGNALFAVPGNGAPRKGAWAGLSHELISFETLNLPLAMFPSQAMFPSHGAGAALPGLIHQPVTPGTCFSTGVSGHGSLLPGLLERTALPLPSPARSSGWAREQPGPFCSAASQRPQRPPLPSVWGREGAGMGLTPILRWEKALGKVGTSEGELLGGLELSVGCCCASRGGTFIQRVSQHPRGSL